MHGVRPDDEVRGNVMAASPTNDRYLMISCDAHAGAAAEAYRPYLEQQYHEALTQWAPTVPAPGKEGREQMLAAMGERAAEIFGSLSQRFAAYPEVLAGGEDGYYDFERRIKELENDGIVGDVIIHQGYPFSDAFEGLPNPFDWATRTAGVRAGNRWLVDKCNENPGRHAGVALIPDMNDIEASAKELDELIQAGLKGGVMLHDSPTFEWPAFNHPRYEPLWEVLDQYALPVHTHLGTVFGGPTTPIEGPGGFMIAGMEMHFRTSRAFWAMYFGGVFERHPGVKFSFTEHGVEWIPEMIRHMTKPMVTELAAFEEQLSEMTGYPGSTLELTPAEIWQRQGFAGASFMPKKEADMRYEIGVDTLMWGSDYPHPEGTWPNTRDKLKRALQDVPVDEKRKILGETALRCYSAAFDPEFLRREADRVGLGPDDV
jgi:predicted TIM-barrel fold metal-dependent hydrolase